MKLAILLFFVALTGVCLAEPLPYSDEVLSILSFPPWNDKVDITPELDVNCDCLFNWIGPHGYYNYWTLTDLVFAAYHDPAHWRPDPNIEIVPCQVCFVFIQGRGVTFIDEFEYVNELHIGGRSWDDTILVVGGPGRSPTGETINLRIDYDTHPVIFNVDGERLTNGQTLLRIVGKGFGFIASDITITATDATKDRPQWDKYDYTGDCPYELVNTAKKCDANGHPSILTPPGFQYPCNNVRVYHHDSYLTCVIDTVDVFPWELEVTVNVFGLSATQTILSTYIQ